MVKSTGEISMSRYCTVKTQFKDGRALVQALMETGNWTEAQIEINNVPQNLFGYKGDMRTEKAHIIIRRLHVGEYSNDIGFVKDEDGCYVAIISSYDKGKYGEAWNKQLKGNYAFHKVRTEQEARGRTVSRTRCPNTGRQRVEITGYR
jgi:hypothetical protein